MRDVMLHDNAYTSLNLLKGLGAFAGLFFEIGSRRLVVAGNADDVAQAEQETLRKQARVRHGQVLADEREASAHTEMQYTLIHIGHALGYEVFVARNDRHRSCYGEAFSQLTLSDVPALPWPNEVMDTVRLIDVIWLARKNHRIVAAFKVKKSTSIYSNILRLKDLARSISTECCYYLVAPGQHEKEVAAQFVRPSFAGDKETMRLGSIPYSELTTHCDAVSRLREDHTVIDKLVRTRSFQDRA